MNLKKDSYKERLIDKTINRYLKVFGAISIEGPKWCGKTWTALNHVKSVSYMFEDADKNLALFDPRLIFNEKSKRPQLIDEWQLVPTIWDAVRYECDNDSDKGKFILTGSTTLSKEVEEAEVHHSGAGRIAVLKMYPMSLFESGDSTGQISLTDMFNGENITKKTDTIGLRELARLIIRGGWPDNINVSDKNMDLIPKSYIDAVVTKDIHERKDRKRDSAKMLKLMKSLARNESSLASNNKIVSDIEKYINETELSECRQTIADYLSVLNDLYIICDQPAFDVKYRASARVGKVAKRHFVDPSLACACLGLTVEKMMSDFNTFGVMLEALVVRDLRIYIEYLGGHIYHFRDSNSGDEVDAIIEFSDGSYATIEIKLSYRGIDDAKKSLLKFYENVEKKPKFMCIIIGTYGAIIKDPETGIYIFPITALKP